MKRIFLTFITLLAFYCQLSGTPLSLSDLEAMCSKTSWDEVNVFLANKNWIFYDSSAENVTEGVYHQTIIWTFEKTSSWSYVDNKMEDRAVGWLYLYTDAYAQGKPSAISLQDVRLETYTKILNEIKTKGYKQISSQINNGETVVTYENAIYKLIVTNTKTNKLFYIFRKGSYYDEENGKKVLYDTDGNLESKYTLKNGKRQGMYYGYHSNGKLSCEIPYINGVVSGRIKGYYESGKVRIEATMKDGKRVGSATYYIYDDEQLVEKWVGEFTVKVYDWWKTFIRVSNEEQSNYIAYVYENGIFTEEHHMKLHQKNDYGRIIAYNNHKQVIHDVEMLGDSIHGKAQHKYYDDKFLIKELTLQYNNGQKDGVSVEKCYENGKLTSVETNTYHNDELNGESNYTIFQDDSTQLSLTINYNNGIKDGLEMFRITENDSTYTYSYKTYSKGRPIGSFQEVKNDTLIIGTYNYSGLLHGRYRVYRDKHHPLFGGLINTDTTKLDKVIIGEYDNGRMNGYWKFYDSGFFTKTNVLRLEGTYSYDKKTGKWKYYYPNPLPFSIDLEHDEEGNVTKQIPITCSTTHGGELYLIESYRNDLLNGESIRYSSISDSYNDSTYQKFTIKSFYTNGVLDGSYVHLDSLGNIVVQGSYKNGQRDFIWKFNNTTPVNGLSLINVTYDNGKWIRTHATDSQFDYCFEFEHSTSLNMKKYIDNGNQIGEYSYFIPNYLKEKLDSAIVFIPDIKTLELNGRCKFWDESGKLVLEEFYENNRKTINTEYLTEQNVKRITHTDKSSEVFVLISNGAALSSGTIEYIKGSQKEIIKIKNGFRNGKTKIVDKVTGKTIKTYSYKNGVKIK